MGGVGNIVDPSRLTNSGNRCLDELTQISLVVSGSEVMAEWVVSSVVTSVEAHFDRVLIALINASGIESSRFAAALLNEVSEKIFASWRARLDWFKKGFAISVAGDKPIQDLILLTELRNAFIHGNGELTALQGRSLLGLLQLKKKLSTSLNVGFQGNRVTVGPDVIAVAIKIARDAVVHLDSALRVEYPDLRGI